MYLKMNTKYNAIPKKGKNSLKDGKYWETQSFHILQIIQKQ